MKKQIINRPAWPLLGVFPALLLGACAEEGPFSAKSAAFSQDTTVFINELHYDNVGTDVGEAIEIVGPAGTDLSAYSLVLYNGNGGAVYDTKALSGVLSDEGEGYGTVSVAYPSNGIQNGAPDGIALVRGTEVIQLLSYEGTFTAVGGPAAGLLSTDISVLEDGTTLASASLQLVGSGSVYGDFTWSAPTDQSFGSVNSGQSFVPGDTTSGDGDGDGDSGDGDGEPTETCGSPATRISAVQGSGSASPLLGEVVSIEGVVVGDFQGSGADLGGFFVQDRSPDSDPLSSEGVFVFEPTVGVDVELGDRVRVTGSVSEYYDLTEISATKVTVCGAGTLPEATMVALPYANNLEFEAVEGMLVKLSDLTVTETYDLGRYGEVALSAQGRLFNPTNAAGATVQGNLHSRILLDDGKDAQNLEPVPYLGADGTLRIGDQLSTLTAVMHTALGFTAYSRLTVMPSSLPGRTLAQQSPMKWVVT